LYHLTVKHLRMPARDFCTQDDGKRIFDNVKMKFNDVKKSFNDVKNEI
jgi:hypothetical protein